MPRGRKPASPVLRLAKAGDLVLAPIRETVYRRSLPLATRDLRIIRSSLGDTAGLIGAAFMVIDELFSRAQFEQWIDDGSPIGHTEIIPRSPGTETAGFPPSVRPALLPR